MQESIHLYVIIPHWLQFTNHSNSKPTMYKKLGAHHTAVNSASQKNVFIGYGYIDITTPSLNPKGHSAKSC
jgi:hypothetical protein